MWVLPISRPSSKRSQPGERSGQDFCIEVNKNIFQMYLGSTHFPTREVRHKLAASLEIIVNKMAYSVL